MKSKDAQNIVAAMEHPTCLFPNCNQYSYSRGLCGNHYRAARGLVINGKTTWAKLIELGKAKNVKPKGKRTPATTWFLND